MMGESCYLKENSEWATAALEASSEEPGTASVAGTPATFAGENRLCVRPGLLWLALLNGGHRLTEARQR